ncbi:GDP-mannose-dependent alpha-(1-2)-phosphatidylinositol mannosyltransferase [Pseudooceanicola marinus]|uniref:GDP-mannose-dependent alpha-(1-2)-phosphatidylinositol mannosyltransferase n=1 Tax=Pseudooceanicola marinus TaxID=396013 RepID=A0A1X7A3D0_9RHOB|nr:glycosyltransferase [Pseudooceanicola marinus]PJE31137.1 glycosyl transferase [Pseudooceanicola marinus]SLN69417.1 GDP-mannose-dependent alpha-(1-2)-phosphatidylinositol mannosyltransferase [Pseudooceanicola marinus]
MNILFIHQNFPGQFKHLAVALAARGHSVTALTLRVKEPATWRGVRVLPYTIQRKGGQQLHPWLVDMDSKVTRAEACFHAARRLREQGYQPDVIIAHHGWGESLFLRDVWPRARMGIYCELYHLAGYPHLNFDPEFRGRDEAIEPLRIRMKNLNNHLHFDMAQAGISPTRFQADTFPATFRPEISVIHDGIDTGQVKPDPEVRFELEEGGRVLTRDDEVITFVNRNLEPYRGYHIFMRALPELLRARPKAQVLITGGDGTSYGAKPPEGKTWKQIFIDEVRDRIPDEDWARVHFLGRIPYARFLDMLRLSRLHVYLTYPFVLSWSLLEAMATEAAIVASDTAPVREVIEQDRTGRLVDFFDPDALTAEICALLDDRAARERLGRAARAHILENYDLGRICLPRQIDWVERLAAMPAPPLPE